jgi:hypothetical protein
MGLKLVMGHIPKSGWKFGAYSKKDFDRWFFVRLMIQRCGGERPEKNTVFGVFPRM